MSQQAFLLIGQAWLADLLAQSINAIFLTSQLSHLPLCGNAKNCLILTAGVLCAGEQEGLDEIAHVKSKCTYVA